jgi:hypothetical protein
MWMYGWAMLLGVWGVVCVWLQGLWQDLVPCICVVIPLLPL